MAIAAARSSIQRSGCGSSYHQSHKWPEYQSRDWRCTREGIAPRKPRLLAEVSAKDKTRIQAEHCIGRIDSLWLGNFDNAVGYFENAVNKNPKRADAWFKWVTAKSSKVRTKRRFKAYQQAVQLKPDSDEVRNKLGDAYYYSGRLIEAIASYKKPLACGRTAPSPLQSCARLFREWRSRAGPGRSASSQTTR